MTKQQTTLRQAAMLAVGFLILFIGGGSRFAIGLVLKPLEAEFGGGRSMMGIAVAVSFVVSAICLFVSGRMADRMNVRLVLGAGLLIAALGIGLMSLMTAAWQAVVLFGVVFAIGNGIASITAVVVLITRWFPGRAELANSVAISGMGFGQLVMIALLAAVLVEIGWRWVFALVGIAHILMLPLVLGVGGGSGDQSAAGAGARPAGGMSMREAAGTRQLWLLLVIYACCGFTDFFITTHIVAFAQDQGMGVMLAGNLLALMGLTALLGVVLAGAWSDRSGPWAPACFCFFVRVAMFAWILVDKSTVSLLAFAVVYGVTFLMTAPLTVMFVRQSFGHKNLGGITGLITMVHHISGGVGAYVGAALFDANGNYDVVFVVILALSVSAGVLTLFLQRGNAQA